MFALNLHAVYGFVGGLDLFNRKLVTKMNQHLLVTVGNHQFSN